MSLLAPPFVAIHQVHLAYGRPAMTIRHTGRQETNLCTTDQCKAENLGPVPTALAVRAQEVTAKSQIIPVRGYLKMTAASEGMTQTTKFQDVPRDLSDRALNHIANFFFAPPPQWGDWI